MLNRRPQVAPGVASRKQKSHIDWTKPGSSSKYGHHLDGRQSEGQGDEVFKSGDSPPSPSGVLGLAPPVSSPK